MKRELPNTQSLAPSCRSIVQNPKFEKEICLFQFPKNDAINEAIAAGLAMQKIEGTATLPEESPWQLLMFERAAMCKKQSPVGFLKQ